MSGSDLKTIMADIANDGSALTGLLAKAMEASRGGGGTDLVLSRGTVNYLRHAGKLYAVEQGVGAVDLRFETHRAKCREVSDAEMLGL